MEDNNFSDFSSFINTSEKGGDSLVFQLGSHSVKFGYATQMTPFIIPNCIAYKLNNINNINNQTNEHANMEIDENITIEKPENSKENEAFLIELTNLEQEILKKMTKLEQKMKGKNKITINNKNPAKVNFVFYYFKYFC